MKNMKILKSQNLFENLAMFSGKKICAMVKSNAYGHGTKEIVELIEDKVECFGVVNIEEGLKIRKLTEKPIMICSKCHDFKTCKNKGFEVLVDDETDLEMCLKYGLKDNCHLKINSGMNRFGVKSQLNIRIMNEFLKEHDFNLKSISTHFHFTENRKQTFKDYINFLKLRVEIEQNAPICFGGSNLIDYPFDFDILRLGIGLYGYGNKNLLPVMEIKSFVSKVFFACAGEFVGYGKKYKVEKDGFFAVVPVGYGDGLRRNLSGKFCVEINGKVFQSVGNICMDAFFVKIDKTVKEGDIVCIMQDAEIFAKQLKTISYEILTSFSNFRGQTVVE